MKKFLSVLFIIFCVVACKEKEFSPEGPTDVRVKNVSVSDTTLLQVVVNTSGGIETMGDITPGGVSEYKRFSKAFPIAEISATFKGQTFSTGTVDYNAITYIGQAKITYEVRISDYVNKKLKIRHCSLDAPLD